MQSRFSLHLRVVLVFGGLCSVASLASAEEPAKSSGPPTIADYDAFVSESDRDHWSFKSVTRPEIPTVKDGALVLFELSDLDAYCDRAKQRA